MFLHLVNCKPFSILARKSKFFVHIACFSQFVSPIQTMHKISTHYNRLIQINTILNNLTTLSIGCWCCFPFGLPSLSFFPKIAGSLNLPMLTFHVGAAKINGTIFQSVQTIKKTTTVRFVWKRIPPNHRNSHHQLISDGLWYIIQW